MTFFCSSVIAAFGLSPASIRCLQAAKWVSRRAFSAPEEEVAEDEDRCSRAARAELISVVIVTSNAGDEGVDCQS
jgi:hypothetical protein